jgi:hypothetical protein
MWNGYTERRTFRSNIGSEKLHRHSIAQSGLLQALPHLISLARNNIFAKLIKSKDCCYSSGSAIAHTEN